MKAQKQTVPSAHQQRADEAQANADRAQQVAEELHRQRDAAMQETEAAHREVEEAQQTVRKASADVPVREEKAIVAQQRAERSQADAARNTNPDLRQFYERHVEQTGQDAIKIRAKAEAAKRWIDQAKQLKELAVQHVAQLEAKQQRLSLAAADSQRIADEAQKRADESQRRANEAASR